MSIICSPDGHFGEMTSTVICFVIIMLTTYTVRAISNTDISDGYIIIYFMYLSGGVQLYK